MRIKIGESTPDKYKKLYSTNSGKTKKVNRRTSSWDTQKKTCNPSWNYRPSKVVSVNLDSQSNSFADSFFIFFKQSRKQLFDRNNFVSLPYIAAAKGISVSKITP